MRTDEPREPAHVDPFWRRKFRDGTYIDVIRSITTELGRLTGEFPQLAGFDATAVGRDIVDAPRKLIAYAHDVALLPLDPEAPPGTHRQGLLVHKPTSEEGVLITIEFHTPEEAQSRMASSEQRLAPTFIGEMFVESEVIAADPGLEGRVRSILREAGLRVRDD